MLFVSPLSGRLFDQYGPRLPIAIGTFMHVFGLMMASLSSKYYQFVLSQSVCSGIGASLIFAPAMTAVTTHISPHLMLLADSISAADDILPETTSNCRRFSDSRLVVRRCHIPNHGRPPASQSRFRLDNENLRLSHPRPTHHHKFDGLLASTTHCKAVQIKPILRAAAGNQLHSDVPWKLLLVLQVLFIPWKLARKLISE